MPPVYFSAFYAKLPLRSDMTRNTHFWTQLKTYFPITQTSNSVHRLLVLFLWDITTKYRFRILLQSAGSVHYWKVQVPWIIANYRFHTLSQSTGSVHYCEVQVPYIIAKYWFRTLLQSTGSVNYCKVQVPYILQSTGSVHYCKVQVPWIIAKYRFHTLLQSTGSVHYCKVQVPYTLNMYCHHVCNTGLKNNGVASSLAPGESNHTSVLNFLSSESIT
jgi:hypothetical protein